MRASRLILICAVAALAALALVACGGDDDDGGGNADEEQITEAIEQAATSDDPARCTEFQTQAFTEQTELATGEEAVAACEENDGDRAGDSVEVDKVAVDGDSATAEVAFTGGGLDGQTLAISLVKEGDQWKADRLEEWVSFDKEAFSAAITESASADDVPDAIVECLEQTIRQTPDQELQSIYLGGDESQLNEIFGPCFGGS
jgi:hypothetical protein